VRIGSQLWLLLHHGTLKQTSYPRRSTKVAGKLKVLPEQPEQPLPSRGSRVQQPVDDPEVPALKEILNDAELNEEEEDEEEDELQDPEDDEVRHTIVVEADLTRKFGQGL
jgi:hypothetical protein